MIVEQRTYTLKPGRVPEYLRLYEQEGLAVQSRHLGHPLGYYSSETGVLNQLVHMWGYSDANDRHARRVALYADPDWQALVPKLFDLIDTMETRLLAPAPFFATHLRDWMDWRQH